MVPGTRSNKRGMITTIASVATPSNVAAPETVLKWTARIRIRPTKSLGIAPGWRPKKSRICVLAMRTAMPLVKPTTTGRGMNFTAEPSPETPIASSMTPAIIVHM